MSRIGRMTRSAKMKARTPPNEIPPFQSTAASGTFPIEQTKLTTATSGPTSGPHTFPSVGWWSRKTPCQNDSGTHAAKAPAIKSPPAMSRQMAAQSMTKKFAIDVNPSGERRRCQIDPRARTLMSISAWPSIEPSRPRSAWARASATSAGVSSRRKATASVRAESSGMRRRISAFDTSAWTAAESAKPRISAHRISQNIPKANESASVRLENGWKSSSVIDTQGGYISRQVRAPSRPGETASDPSMRSAMLVGDRGDEDPHDPSVLYREARHRLLVAESSLASSLRGLRGAANAILMPGRGEGGAHTKAIDRVVAATNGEDADTDGGFRPLCT